MDEIWFHVSNQLETLQVQASLTAQQGQQWISAWLAQASQLFREIYNDRNAQYVKDVLQNILADIRRGWHHIQLQYYTASFYPTGLCRHVLNACSNEASRREVAFCLAGVAAGTLIGFYTGVNWRTTSRQIHRMKAVVCHHYLGIEGVSLIEDAERPTIQKSNELLIHVKAASVNVVDTKIPYGYSKVYRRLLNFGRCKELPVTLGRDCSGEVMSIGQTVINFDVGDKVFLAVPSWAPGTLAEYIVVPEHLVVKQPKHISFELSASLPYSGCLAWDALVNRSTIKEGNAKGKRVLVYGGNTPVGCILTQLVKLWGGNVTTVCKENAVPVTKALGADEAIALNGSDIEKELDLYDKYDAVFYTGGQPIDEYILRQQLLPYGSYVSTLPEQLTSDSLGFICGSIFAGYVRMKLLLQYTFGFNTHRWKDGSKIDATYLQALCNLVDANQLQLVVDRVFGPYNIEQALHHILDPSAIGSTVITFQ